MTPHRSTRSRTRGALTPRALAARLAGDLDAIVLKALRREPPRRYIGAGAFAEDLERFLQGRPVAARPEGRRYRVGKFVRRHRVGIAVAVSLVLSLLGGLAATAWQARAKTLEAQKAEAVKAFLISIFQGADPVQAAGRDITLRQVLDEGAGRVQRDLASQPAVQGELLTVLAGIYGELGITERAAAADRSGARDSRAALRRRQPTCRNELAAEGEAGSGTRRRRHSRPLRATGPGEASACVRQPAPGRGRGSGHTTDGGAPARPAARRDSGRRGIAAHPAERSTATTICWLRIR